MAIRINLLAEAQATEELRRRDPVKRAIWICGLAASLVLAWSATLQIKVIGAKSRLSQLETHLGSQTDKYQQILNNQKQFAEIGQKLTALKQLATNRLLWANTLNALQQTTVSDVQLLRLRSEQTYLLTEETKPRTNEFNKLIPAKPAFVTESSVLTLDARDISVNPGSQIDKFKATLADFPYFHQMLARTNGIVLKTVSPPQTDAETGRPFRQFVLECRLPEKVNR